MKPLCRGSGGWVVASHERSGETGRPRARSVARRDAHAHVARRAGAEVGVRLPGEGVRDARRARRQALGAVSLPGGRRGGRERAGAHRERHLDRDRVAFGVAQLERDVDRPLLAIGDRVHRHRRRCVSRAAASAVIADDADGHPDRVGQPAAGRGPEEPGGQEAENKLQRAGRPAFGRTASKRGEAERVTTRRAVDGHGNILDGNKFTFGRGTSAYARRWDAAIGRRYFLHRTRRAGAHASSSRPTRPPRGSGRPPACSTGDPVLERPGGGTATGRPLASPVIHGASAHGLPFAPAPSSTARCACSPARTTSFPLADRARAVSHARVVGTLSRTVLSPADAGSPDLQRMAVRRPSARIPTPAVIGLAERSRPHRTGG